MGDDNAVSTIMTTNVVTLSPEQSVAEAADLLSERGIGAAPVVDESGKVVGLLRDEDLLLTEAHLHVTTAIEFLGAELIWPPSMHRYEARAAQGRRLQGQRAHEHRLRDRRAHRHHRVVGHADARQGLQPRPRRRPNGALVGIVARGDLIRFLAATSWSEPRVSPGVVRGRPRRGPRTTSGRWATSPLPRACSRS